MGSIKSVSAWLERGVVNKVSFNIAKRGVIKKVSFSMSGKGRGSKVNVSMAGRGVVKKGALA
jgi:hypothetical protein